MKRLLIAVAITVTACATGASPHQRALMAGMAAIDAAKAGFEVFDTKNQADIVENGASRADIDAKKLAYRAKRDVFLADVRAAATAIDAAWKLDTDPSVATAVAAIAAVGQTLIQLGVTK